MCGLAHPKLALALTAMHQRPGVAWTLEALAGEAGMSRSAFAATFKQVLGETPADHLANWRFTLAQQALQQGAPVKLLATDLGYSNASALARAFARKTGTTPREWKGR